MRADANMVPATRPDNTANTAHATPYESVLSSSTPNAGGPTRRPTTIDAYATPVKSPAWLGPPASALITKNTPTQP